MSLIQNADEHEPMEAYCSVPSQIFFSWMGGLVKKGYRSPLTFEDLPDTPSDMDVGRNALVRNYDYHEQDQIMGKTMLHVLRSF